MNNHELLHTILNKAYTKSDALRRLHLLREYLEQSLFSTDSNLTLNDFLDQQNSSDEDYYIMTSWKKSLYNSITQENLYKIINAISEEIKSYPTIIIYLPHKPENKDIKKIGSWFHKNISENILIDIKTDEEKIGGCAFVRNGIYFDYSLHHYIQKNRESILNLINEYATKKKTH